MNPIRIGFVGVGGMGQCAHLRNYATNSDCQVVAIAEIKQDMAKKVAARYGIAHVYPDHRAMLAKEKLDAIVCIQQFIFHGSLLPEVYSAGVPVLTEKPLAGSIETGLKLLGALKQSKASHYVAYHKRSDPATMWARKQIDTWTASGEVGKLRYVRVTMPPGDWTANGFLGLIHGNDPVPPLTADPRPQSYTQEAFDKYIGFVNYYIHQVNLLRHLLGEDYSVEYADKPGRLLVARSTSGVTCEIEMAPYDNTIAWQEQALVCFDKGWIKLELPAPMTINQPGRVTAYTDAGNKAEPRTISPTLPWIDAMQQQAKNFIAAVKGETTPLCKAADAIKDLEVARDYMAFLSR